MGYFPNGTALREYEARYCDRCAHFGNQQCPVWEQHVLFGYAGDDTQKNMLDLVIERDGIENKKCKMFIERWKVANNANEEETILNARSAARADVKSTATTPPDEYS